MLYPGGYRRRENARDGDDSALERERSLLVEMFHGSGTENDEETDPECGSLKGNRLVGYFFICIRVIGFEDHGIEEECQEAEDEKQFDEEDGQVFGMMLDSAAGLRSDDLIDVVEVDPTGKQEDDE